MENEQLQKLAKEFCEAENANRFYPVNFLGEYEKEPLHKFLAKLLCSIIEKNNIYSAKWVEIKSYKDLPKNDCHVLVYGRFTKDCPKKVYQASFRVKNGKFYSDGILSKDVNHWQPLPPAPGESTVSSAGKEVTDEEIIKTFDICSEEEGYVNWNHVLVNFEISTDDVKIILLNSVKNILKNQFKATHAKEITDQDVMDYVFSSAVTYNPNGKQDVALKAIKWYQSQLKAKP